MNANVAKVKQGREHSENHQQRLKIWISPISVNQAMPIWPDPSHASLERPENGLPPMVPTQPDRVWDQQRILAAYPQIQHNQDDAKAALNKHRIKCLNTDVNAIF